MIRDILFDEQQSRRSQMSAAQRVTRDFHHGLLGRGSSAHSAHSVGARHAAPAPPSRPQPQQNQRDIGVNLPDHRL